MLRPDLPAERAFELTMLAAVALAEALEGFGVVPEIKWPNDVELEGKKVAGILSELAAGDGGETRFVVLGVGVNVDGAATDFPDFAAACHWYAAMNAMHIMALEANA